MTLIDSYSESNQNDYVAIADLHPSDSSFTSAVSQSFQNLDGVYKLTSCKFYLRKYGSPTGIMYAKLFAHSGTFGSNSKPTGTALATSNGFDVSTLTTSYQLIEFTFPPGQQYEMQANAYYCIAVGFITSGTLDSSNALWVGIDSSSPTHAGNLASFWLNAWSAYSAFDVCFYIYGELAGGVTHEIYVDAAVQTLASHVQQCMLNIEKDATVRSQAVQLPETTFNIPKDAAVQAFSFHAEETLYNLVRDAVTEVIANAIAELGILKDAIVQASATRTIEVMFTIPKGVIVQAIATPSLQSNFNLNPEATVKVLAEVKVVKEAEIKVTKLFLLMGNLAIQLTGD